MVLPYINMNLPQVHTLVPHLEPSSLLPPRTIPLGHPSAPAPSIQYRASNLDWQLVSYILYVFKCHSPKSSHLRLLSQSPKVCSLHLCLFCYLTYSPTTSWEIDGETVETVSEFIFLGSKITTDGDCSHEIKRRLLLGRKVMTNLDGIFKSRNITLRLRSI